jgi:hypothetical protein
MKDYYKAYIRAIDNVPHFFVKHLIEYGGSEPLVEGFGMHTNFEKACSIAGLHDAVVMKEIYPVPLQTNETKVVDIQSYKGKKVSG